MTQGQSIANIRLQYNIPANVSDSEVQKFAQDNNIVIDFSGNNNSASTANTKNNTGWFSSLFSIGATSDATNANGGAFNATQNQSASLFGNGFVGDAKSDAIEGFSIEKTITPVVQQQVIDTTTFAEWQKNEQAKIENNQAPKQVNAENQSKTETTVNQTKTQNSTLDSKMDDVLVDILGENSNVKVTNKEINNGICRATLSDGRIVEISLKQGEDGFDATKHRSDIAYKIYNKGKVLTQYGDGKTEERIAVKGEEGYVKDGEGFNERLARFYGMSPEKFDNLSPDKKKDYAKRYIEQYLGGKNSSVQIGDFKKLLKNSDPNSEMGRLLTEFATELDDKVVNEAIEEVYGTRQTDNDVAVVTETLNTNMSKFNDNIELQQSLITQSSQHIVNENNVESYSTMTRSINPKNQSYAVTQGYENIDEALMPVYRNDVTSNIANYHKDAQLDVAKVSLQYDDENHTGAQNLADHTHETDVEIQKELAQILLDLQVDSVSGKIASHAYEYDITNRDDIIQMIKDHGTEGAKQILEEATRKFEQEAEMKAQYAENKKAEAERLNNLAAQREQSEVKVQKDYKTQSNTEPKPKTSETPVKTSSASFSFVQNSQLKQVKELMQTKTVAEVIHTKEFKQLDIKERVRILNNLDSTRRKETIKSLCENSESFELQNYMYTALKTDIIKYFVQHPTQKNTDKLRYIESFLGAADKDFINELKSKKNNENAQLTQKINQANPFKS